MKRYTLLGDILVPGQVTVLAEDEDDAREKADDPANWIDHVLYETHKPYYLALHHPESAEIQEEPHP